MKTSKNQKTTIELWKNRILFEKEISDEKAFEIAKESMEMILRMKKEIVIITYYKQDGTFCLEKATLMNYSNEFHKEFDIDRVEDNVLFWSLTQGGWRTFRMGNLVKWIPWLN